MCPRTSPNGCQTSASWLSRSGRLQSAVGNRFSLRLRDASMGAIGILLIVLGIILVPLAASFGMMPIIMLFALFSPAVLIAIYSLFFEQSKIYGVLGLFLTGVAVLIQPLASYWAELCAPEMVAFVAFCTLLSLLKRFRYP
jgi:hypothetical protein